MSRRSTLEPHPNFADEFDRNPEDLDLHARGRSSLANSIYYPMLEIDDLRQTHGSDQRSKSLPRGHFANDLEKFDNKPRSRSEERPHFRNQVSFDGVRRTSEVDNEQDHGFPHRSSLKKSSR